MRGTKRDWLHRTREGRIGFAQDVLTILLLRWIVVAALLLGIAALASGEIAASDLRGATRGTRRTAGNVH